jgi:tRNA (guanine-N7-)-methyltransferase
MSEAQERHFAEMMPKIGLVYAPQQIDLAAVYGRNNPKILEIGTGMGETTAKIADANRDNDYLGVEVHVPGVGALCKQIAERNLTNLRICQHDAVEVVRDMLPEASLDGVHIFFPDPWHKARHNKRRLIQSPFVALLASRLKPGGYFSLRHRLGGVRPPDAGSAVRRTSMMLPSSASRRSRRTSPSMPRATASGG